MSADIKFLIYEYLLFEGYPSTFKAMKQESFLKPKKPFKSIEQIKQTIIKAFDEGERDMF